jgi:hypothetical protein
MTTTVTVLIEGNKKCRVCVIEADGTPVTGADEERGPGSITKLNIHGDQRVEVQETGEFVS